MRGDRSKPIVNLCPSCGPAFRDVRVMFANASPATRISVRAGIIQRCHTDHIRWHPRPDRFGGSGWMIERDDDTGEPVRLRWWAAPPTWPHPVQWVSRLPIARAA
jgi:hypothetical protein